MRGRSCFLIQVTKIICLIEIMSRTIIEFDDAVYTIGTLPKVELHPYNDCLLKLDESINANLDMIPFTGSSVLGWARMVVRPGIDELSESNPCQTQKTMGCAPWYENPISTETKVKVIGNCGKYFKPSKFIHQHQLCSLHSTWPSHPESIHTSATKWNL